jgi:hypothetical protein
MISSSDPVAKDGIRRVVLLSIAILKEKSHHASNAILENQQTRKESTSAWIRNRTMVKTKIQKLVAVMAVTLLVASLAAAQGKQDFTLHNNTGVEIHKLFISPHDTNEWEEDILGKDTLADGDSLEINFSRKETAKMWDLKIVDKEGTSIEWENLNLLEISEVTLHFKDGKPTATVK